MVNWRTTLRLPINYKKLRKLRERKGLCQYEVQEACDINPGHLTQFECGRANPSLPTVERLAKFYEVPVSDLLTDGSQTELLNVACKLADMLGAQLVFKTTNNEPELATG